MKSSWLFLRLNELEFGKKKERKSGAQADKFIYVRGKKKTPDGISYGTSNESQRISNSRSREIPQEQDEKGMMGNSRQ